MKTLFCFLFLKWGWIKPLNSIFPLNLVVRSHSSIYWAPVCTWRIGKSIARGLQSNRAGRAGKGKTQRCSNSPQVSLTPPKEPSPHWSGLAHGSLWRNTASDCCVTLPGGQQLCGQHHHTGVTEFVQVLEHSGVIVGHRVGEGKIIVLMLEIRKQQSWIT